MGLEIGKEYYIRNVETGLYLNVLGYDTVGNGRNVTLYQKENVNAQKWIVTIRGGGAVVHTKINTGYGLNINQYDNNNCTMWPIAGNDADAIVDFLTVNASQNLYRIKMIAHNKLLRATGYGNLANVNWYNYADNFSLWQLEEVGAAPTTSGAATVENLSQHDYGNQSHGDNTFCYATCILSLLRYYKGSSFTMQRLINEGIVRASDGYVLKNDTNYHMVSGYNTLNYSEICDEISAGRPVVIYGLSVDNAGTANDIGHFVVADSFTSPSAAGIMVMDPWTGSHVSLNQSTLQTYTHYRTFTIK